MSPTLGDALPSPHHRIELLLRHEPYLRRIAHAVAGSGADVDDIMQETMLAVWKNRPQGAARRAWLAGIVRNLALMARRARLRRRRHEERGAVPETVDSFWARLNADEQRRHLARAISALPTSLRDAIEQRFFEGLTYPEMGRIARRAPDTMRARVGRALRELRAKLPEQREEPRGLAWAAVLAAGVLVVGTLMFAAVSRTGASGRSGAQSSQRSVVHARARAAAGSSERHEQVAVGNTRPSPTYSFVDDDPNRRDGSDLSVTGVVMRDGRPVTGAVIEARRAYASSVSWAQSGPPLTRAVADHAGHFLLTLSRRCRWTLIAHTPGSAPECVLMHAPLRGDPGPVVIELRRGRVLRGWVEDEGGQSVASAAVTVVSGGIITAPYKVAARTDSQGRFAVRVAEPDRLHSVRVCVYTRGFLDQRTLVRPDRHPVGSAIRIVLRRGEGASPLSSRRFRVSGFVAPRARVTLLRRERGRIRDRAFVRADADGRFVVDDVEPGGYLVEFRVPGRARLHRREHGREVSAPAPLPDLVVVDRDIEGLRFPGVPTGRVVVSVADLGNAGTAGRSRDRQALSWIRWQAAGLDVKRWFDPRTPIVLENVPAGAPVVVTAAHWQASAPFLVPVGDVRHVRLRPDRFAAVACIVEDEDGRPVRDAAVALLARPAAARLRELDDRYWFPGWSRRTDRRGRALLVVRESDAAGLANGFVVAATHPKHPRTIRAVAIPLARGETRTVRLRVVRGRRIAGQVVGAEGRPRPAEWIAIGNRRARTGPDGRFAVDGLAPGTHRLRALATNTEVEARAGNLDVRLVLPPRSSRVRGIVLDASGREIGGAHVVLEADGRSLDDAWSDRDGRFSFSVVPQKYRVRIVADRARGEFPASPSGSALRQFRLPR